MLCRRRIGRESGRWRRMGNAGAQVNRWCEYSASRLLGRLVGWFPGTKPRWSFTGCLVSQSVNWKRKGGYCSPSLTSLTIRPFGAGTPIPGPGDQQLQYWSLTCQLILDGHETTRQSLLYSPCTEAMIFQFKRISAAALDVPCKFGSAIYAV